MRTRQVLLASWAAFAVVIVVAIGTIGTAAAEPGQPPGSTGKGPLSPRLQEIAAAEPRTTTGLGSALVAVGLPESGFGSLMRGPGVSVEVMIRVAVVSDETRQALTAAGAQITVASSEVSSYAAYVAPKDLSAVTAVPGVIAASEVLQTRMPSSSLRSALPAAAATTSEQACSPTTSLADTQLKAALARTNFGVDGTGVKIGVMSDSFAHVSTPTSAAQDVATGNLPGVGNPCGRETPVEVIADNLPGGQDEGRAMLQLVHKVAPGATLLFATAQGGGQIGFANNIRALAAAGANVIVDDHLADGETMFQDDIVDKAIADVTAVGVTYVAAAGNTNFQFNGRDVASLEMESFRPTSCPPVLPTGDQCLDFAPSGQPSNTAWYTIRAGDIMEIMMGYSEPLYGVTDNLDLYVLSNDETSILASSTTNSIATGMPSKFAGVLGDLAADKTVKIVISRSEGSGSPRTKLVLPIEGAFVAAEYTNSDWPMTVGPSSIIGHAGGTNTFSIAATDGLGAGTTPESFSARGPVTHYWGPFTTAATPATAIPATVLAKPDVAATDDDCTTFFQSGGPPGPTSCPYNYSGTSAAAPNAAGVAALVLSRNKTLTPAQVKAIMAASAAPMSGGSLLSTGAGLLDANAALGLVPTPAPVPTPVLVPAAVVQAQGPLTGCVTVPNAVPAHGRRKLQRRHCLTNAGQQVKVRVTGRLRGDVALWKVIRKKNGAVFINTYGRHLKLRITWTAPATAGYAAYTFTRTYRT